MFDDLELLLSLSVYLGIGKNPLSFVCVPLDRLLKLYGECLRVSAALLVVCLVVVVCAALLNDSLLLDLDATGVKPRSRRELPSTGCHA